MSVAHARVPPEAAVDAVRRSAARPLPPPVLAEMEARFDWRFGDVRVHAEADGARAALGLDARAVTVGRDIAFAPGRFAPETGPGRHLLAHELAHVVQQARGGSPLGPAHEAAADQAAARVMQGSAATVAGGAMEAPQRAPLSLEEIAAKELGIEAQKPPPIIWLGTKPSAEFQIAAESYVAMNKVGARSGLVILAPPPAQPDWLKPKPVQRMLTPEEQAAKRKRLDAVAGDLRLTNDLAAMRLAASREFLDHWKIVRVTSEFFGGTTPPDLLIWTNTQASCEAGLKQVAAGNEAEATRRRDEAQSRLRTAQGAWARYMDKVIGGAESVQSKLETTRNVAFGVALAAGAAAAAPIALGAAVVGVEGLGITGVGATILSTGGAAIGTGVAVGGGGMVLGGGSELLASGITTGQFDWQAADRQARALGKQGFVMGITAGTGLGAARGFGTSIGGRLLSDGIASGTGEMVGAKLEGRSQDDILRAGGRGFLLGGASGLINGTLAPVLPTKGLQIGAQALTGGGMAAASTYATTGSLDKSTDALWTGALTAGLVGSATPVKVDIPPPTASPPTRPPLLPLFEPNFAYAYAANGGSRQTPSTPAAPTPLSMGPLAMMGRSGASRAAPPPAAAPSPAPGAPREPQFDIDPVTARPGGLDRATARTGGIERITKGVNKLGEMTVTIVGDLLEPLYRGDPRNLPAGRAQAPDYNTKKPFTRGPYLEQPVAEQFEKAMLAAAAAKSPTGTVSPAAAATIRQQAEARAAALAQNYEAAHLWGPGFGDEAAAGMMFAPRQMNQELQNRLAEQSMRTLRALAAQQNGKVRIEATVVAFHPDVVEAAGLPRSLRFAQHVSYRIILEAPPQAGSGGATVRTAEVRMTVSADTPSARAGSHLTFDSGNAESFLTEILQ